MNGRVNDKVTEADLEAICSKRCDEMHSHDLSPEDIVRVQSKLRAVMSGPGPIERILPDKPSSLNLNPAASKQPIRTIDADKLAQKQQDIMEDLKLSQKQKDMMEDLMQAVAANSKRVQPLNLNPYERFPAPLEPKPQPASEPKKDASKEESIKYRKTVEELLEQIKTTGEIEKQMKTIGEEYERVLASKTAAEAYKSALAAKAALMTMHAKENAETARRQQAAEKLVEAELIRAAHRLKFELWASERLRNTS